MAHNLAQCRVLVQKAVAAGAKALFLPEASDYIAPNASTSLSLCLPASTSPFVLGLRDLARNHNMPINVGIHEPATTSGSGSITKIKNTLIWISASGEITHQYHKLHLFDVSIKNGPVLKESQSVEPGSQLTEPFDTVIGKLGMLICFDLRFPEPSLSLRHRGAQILTYPSAFTVPTGQAHWETLLRARAIETQSYVIAAAQCGVHDAPPEGEGKRRSYGHGMVVDPWGRVVAELGGEGGVKLDIGEIAVADIDLGVVEKVREEMPLARRTDVYPQVL
ncbi:hydrolase, carbon-nitrogen family protein [Delitschia confertaspora ATCC 74209]|uniref:Hydrolase, carbon-nitrogen family protein n=1 Tax=Delitschia confertaspora ATCC 74209 TaxID=1513339 RepID=A0A9P4JMR9_9PLEO|nr:hydrolase, carbon-nitrogen family protein [Delitschia confertaspora ATCC 74209]